MPPYNTAHDARERKENCQRLSDTSQPDAGPSSKLADLDQEDDDGDVIPGAWRNVGVMEDMDRLGRGPRETWDGKQLRTYLKHYYCSEVGSVPWQENAIDRPLR